MINQHDNIERPYVDVWAALCGAIGTLALLDLAFTIAAARLGLLAELNPLFAPALTAGYFLGVAALKLGITAGAVAICRVARHTLTGRVGLCVASIAYAFLGLWWMDFWLMAWPARAFATL